MEFRIFHLYNRLAKAGKVKPLTCPNCETTLVTAFGEDDSPVLKCYGCGATIVPGLEAYDQMKAVVNEHYVE